MLFSPVNGVFNDSDYKSRDDGSDDYDALVMREYVYLLTYAEWGFINEFVDGGSLAPEWADDARTSSDIMAKNPLGHALFTDYISKIISKPNETILREIYSSDAPSGYVPGSPYSYPIGDYDQADTFTQGSPSPTDYSFQSGGKQYFLVTDPKSFSDAESYALTLNGHLAVLSSVEENDSVFDNIQSIIYSNNLNPAIAEDGGGAAYVWIGGSDEVNEGTWTWLNGEKFEGVAWGSGSLGSEPDNFQNQDYLAIGLENWPTTYTGVGYGEMGTWNDLDGSNALFSIIEVI